MLTLEEAQTALLARVVPARGTEDIALAAAAGRYTGGRIQAGVDNPAFDNSAMDGYAVRFDDIGKTENRELPLCGEAACGDAPGRLPPGAAMRIFTGAPLPEGADTVVIQEDVTVHDGRVSVPPNINQGSHIRRRGEDFRTGDPLFDTGRRLRPYDLALLSSAGVATVTVIPRPRVLVVATGNELVAPGRPLGPGQIYESNRLATLLQLDALGAAASDGGTVPDNLKALRGVIETAGEYDFVITSGGASVGDHDLVRQAFGERGEIDFWRVRIKPGKPVAFGRLGSGTHFFALPGNPVSSLVTFKLFVEPALIHWHHGRYQRPELAATALGEFRRRPGRREFLRARLTVRGGVLHATPLAGQGSHMLTPLKDTNGFIVLPEDAAGFGDGDPVTVTPLSLDWADG